MYDDELPYKLNYEEGIYSLYKVDFLLSTNNVNV